MKKTKQGANNALRGAGPHYTARAKEGTALEVYRKEIFPFVNLTCLKTNKFKTGCLSVNLLTRLKKETAAKNAIIPRVLRRGTTSHPDMESISALLDGLYGAVVSPRTRKKGEIQVIGFHADFADDAFVPGGGVFERVAQLVGEMLISPNTRGGLLKPQYVESEKQKLIEEIRGRINDKRSYSVQRLFELMCPEEDYSVYKLGTAETADAVNYQTLTKYYRGLLASSPIEVFYCGSAEPVRVERVMANTLSVLPRIEATDALGTDVRTNPIEPDPRYFSDEMNVTQGKLALGFRLGSGVSGADPAAVRVFNAAYGGAVTSKLFMNVREKLSLCYFASSVVDLHKGIMAVSSGIEFDKYDAALSEIFAQLEAMKNGDITADELHAAKKSVATDARSIMDSAGALEAFYLDQNLAGLDYGPAESAELAELVGMEQVVEISNSARCDAVYFLKGSA